MSMVSEGRRRQNKLTLTGDGKSAQLELSKDNSTLGNTLAIRFGRRDISGVGEVECSAGCVDPEIRRASIHLDDESWKV